MKTTRYFDQQVSGDDRPRVLRIVSLADGETVYSGSFDRGFGKDQP